MANNFMIVTLSKVNRPGKSRSCFLGMWIKPYKSSNTNQMGISNSVLVFEWRFGSDSNAQVYAWNKNLDSHHFIYNNLNYTFKTPYLWSVSCWDIDSIFFVVRPLTAGPPRPMFVPRQLREEYSGLQERKYYHWGEREESASTRWNTRLQTES